MASRLNYKGTLQLVDIDFRGIAEQADTNPQNPVGVIHRHDGNLYRYVKLTTGDGPVATVAGAPCWYAPVGTTLQTDLDNNTLQVTSDYSYGSGVFAGVLLKAGITTGKYIWILIAGVITVVVNDDTTVKGDRIYATADGTFTKVSQGTAAFYNTWGVLLEDRGTSSARAFIYPKQTW